jgi:hypothetical protein
VQDFKKPLLHGRSFILINPYDGSVLQSIDARNQPQGIQFLEKKFILFMEHL